ncbi:MAG: transglutaminase family protein [Sphingobium sp.]
MMRLHVNHVTTYRYDAPVPYGLQQLRLTPRPCIGQDIVHWDIRIDGGKKELGFADQYGNQVDLISTQVGAQEISIHSTGEVEVSNRGGILGPHSGFMPLWAYTCETALTKAGPRIRALLRELGSDFDSDIARAHALSALITRHAAYRTGTTNTETTGEQALEDGSGVCQDHAHIFISAMRVLGHPARYVSGYLMMNDRTSQDATHAWAEAHMDGIGWVGFDVSNGYSPDDRYIRIATALDFKGATPVSGLRYGAAHENMFVHLQVQQ